MPNNIMYYFPYLLYFLNFFSFTFHNHLTNKTLNDNLSKYDMMHKTDLWSISRWSYTKYKGAKKFTASYVDFDKTYEFDGKKYLSYDDVVNAAFNI